MTELNDRDMELVLLKRELEEVKLQNARMISDIDLLNEELSNARELLDKHDIEWRPQTDDYDGDYDEPADLEMGFDPYLGCYTDDC